MIRKTPTKTRRVDIRIEDDLHKRLESVADKLQMGVGTAARLAMRRGITGLETFAAGVEL